MILRASFLFLSLVSVSINILLCALLFLVHADFKRRLVYDLDKVRIDYINDMRLAFQHACKIGIDYPEEYRKATTEWNQNSPTNWCNQQLEDFNGTMESWIGYVGKTK